MNATFTLSEGETKWIADMAKINESVIDRSYVVLGPDEILHWVCVFNKEYRGSHGITKTYETWSPLNDQGTWRHYGEPMPYWVAGKPPTLLDDSGGFSLDEIEKAQEIIGELR